MRRRAGAPTDKGEAFDRAFAILGDSGGGETRCKYSSVWSSTLAVRAPACIRGKGGKGDFVGRCEIDPYVSSSCSSSSRTKLKLTNKLPLSLRATQGCHATQYMYMDASAAYADTSSDTDTSSQRVSADSTLNSTHMHTNHKSRRLPGLYSGAASASTAAGTRPAPST